MRACTDEVIDFLNELLAIDPYAISELLIERVPCNQRMADHRTVQVQGAGFYTFIAPGTFRVGLLGLLNGFCGIIEEGPKKGYGPITAVYEDAKLVCFERTNETITPDSETDHDEAADTTGSA